ncbi:hypothetical protein PWG15_21905 (plasmid) [Ensifer adhaerens]|uniref:hypothetical protein n=1 Tax=Ensifer adhaerens TaxID=106592 RepID=UPI0023A9F583|nr:hypothetical protein [Ensifer adhaerens]WDZ80445.1 hypothetical protein PWG15_21905 [Ensifer adhaerens]
MMPMTNSNVGMSKSFRDEIANADPRVGQTLVSETEFVRVWHINLAPGERLGFHRHELDYCWIALTAGRSLSMFADGNTVVTEYNAGDCKVFAFAADETMVHDLTNIGATHLAFTTIEFKGSLAREHDKQV